MQLQAGCQLLFEASAPSPLILMLRPRSGLGQSVIQENCRFEPSVPVVDYIDNYGNLCQRLLSPPGQFAVHTTATVDTPDAIDVQPGAAFVSIEQLPDYTLQFLLPSRYCESDLLGNLANDIVLTDLPAYDQVEAIRSWIHTHIEYRYESSTASTSATETAKTRVGVCRDFVHLGMALCRSLTIPARMVVGYLYELEPMDLHAWFEAFVGGRWYTFDATQSAPRGNRIAIAYGRDAADVALATQFGPVILTEMNVWVHAAG
ncbi:transglutaminase-like domain-containing protein [Leptolyngbya sp. PCC 6406]|uniref:transglutaminase-like domain-containing protein n=1 Tax=Leptolyngbya sp. PCC 6406 TaxID=1173264 RepID=UPI0002AC2B51|nr:transglutaminase family protein [Leptolyngbya sp. PCC 6406]